MHIANSLWHIGKDKGSLGAEKTDFNEKASSSFKRKLTQNGKELFTFLQQASLKENMVCVVASRYGDMTRMVSLFDALYQVSELSPIDFSLSTHNALISLHSIDHKNKCMNTALAGGKDSFMSGLIETYVLTRTYKKEVAYLFYDFPLPLAYQDLMPVQQPSFILIVLTPRKNGSRLTIRFDSYAKNQAEEDIAPEKILPVLKGEKKHVILGATYGGFVIENMKPS